MSAFHESILFENALSFLFTVNGSFINNGDIFDNQNQSTDSTEHDVGFTEKYPAWMLCTTGNWNNNFRLGCVYSCRDVHNMI